jgi:hypothetical protein
MDDISVSRDFRFGRDVFFYHCFSKILGEVENSENEAVLTLYARTSDIGECRMERDLQCK